tara:strand:- start:347 stop:460 length:114 start_codon:yes stop_codon:yes gene_type:complete
MKVDETITLIIWIIGITMLSIQIIKDRKEFKKYYGKK